MTRPAAFNAISRKTKADLAPLKKAIAAMKDLQDNWSVKEDDRFFTFEAFYDPLFKRTLLMGTLHNHVLPGGGMSDDAPTLIMGLPGDELAFKAREIWSDPLLSPEKRIQNFVQTGGGSSCEHNAENADWPVAHFVEFWLSDHPKYKQAVEAAATQVINKTKARPAI